ncbi:MAG: hypothetical protein WCA79_16835 [Anaerolineales bacterium]
MAWDQATEKLLESKSSQQKGCPRDAFLALCEEGLVKGIPRVKYCNSVLNKKYAILALRHLHGDPNLSEQPERLWQIVMEGTKKQHNSQMHVVTALWNSGLIVS